MVHLQVTLHEDDCRKLLQQKRKSEAGVSVIREVLYDSVSKWCWRM